MNDVSAQKKAFRHTVRGLLRKTDSHWFTDSEDSVKKNLARFLNNFDAGAKIAILSWLPHFHGEVDLGLLSNIDVAVNITVFCPRCSSEGDFSFYQMPSEVLAGRFGIAEPVEDISRLIKYAEYTSVICLIPGLAFDAKGRRLGRGKGLYDRFLSKSETEICMLKIGVCWSFQLFGSIPFEEHDRSVDFILTEKEILKADR